MGVREDIKILMFQTGWTLKEVAAEMTKRSGKNYSSANITQKLFRGTLKYEEAKLIGKILGYELKFEKLAKSV